MLENHGASRQRVFAEMRQFLDIVGSGETADEYTMLMGSLPDHVCQQAETLLRDYPGVFADTDGLRMRLLHLVSKAYAAGRENRG